MIKQILINKIVALEKPDALPAAPLQSDGAVENVLGFLFALAGAVALVMIVISGFKYVISRGDPNAIKSAKETLIYAIVGLLIAMFGTGIVTFVFGGIR